MVNEAWKLHRRNDWKHKMCDIFSSQSDASQKTHTELRLEIFLKNSDSTYMQRVKLLNVISEDKKLFCYRTVVFPDCYKILSDCQHSFYRKISRSIYEVDFFSVEFSTKFGYSVSFQELWKNLFFSIEKLAILIVAN